uniref:Argininosuccinate lyase n=1 Tax=Roseihalotalea indica TaxID=2867963 RepID=A0AA49GK32_9BACT|nr:argininosuccinate lyase [Tunicatimonas sp. TK19036]
MKLWQKNSTSIDKRIEQFTIGQDAVLDLVLAPFDILGNLAHSTMLESVGLLTDKELAQLRPALQQLYEHVKQDGFTIEDGVEDVHSQVELTLTRELGDVGKKVHSGRSRNDQVLVDLRLYFRDELKQLVLELLNLFDRLQELSEQHQDVLLPGYTHTQVAMPSSFGLWFGAYAESLTDDMQVLLSAYRVVNQNPLGSAAGYGSSFPLNRTLTTELLGFDDLNYNAVYAQMGRGKSERIVAFGLSCIAATIGKMADDICWYVSQNFQFIRFPDHLTTGSSIMPHKKNPDVFELIRAKCNQLHALPNQIALVTTNMISGYHRDWQVLKEGLFPAFGQLRDCVNILEYALQHVSVNENLMKDDRYRYLFTVERVNEKVLEGKAFRDAYKEVGEEIANGSYQPSTNVKHTHEGSIGNLQNEAIAKKMERVVNQFEFKKVDQALQSLLNPPPKK